MKNIYIKTPNGDRYADSVISNGYELSSENDMFNILYKNNFTLRKAFNIK